MDGKWIKAHTHYKDNYDNLICVHTNQWYFLFIKGHSL